jgi:hypothetical protein
MTTLKHEKTSKRYICYGTCYCDCTPLCLHKVGWNMVTYVHIGGWWIESTQSTNSFQLVDVCDKNLGFLDL